MTALSVITISHPFHLALNLSLMLLNQLWVVFGRIKNPNTAPQNEKRKSLVNIGAPFAVLGDVYIWTGSIPIGWVLEVVYGKLRSEINSSNTTCLKLHLALIRSEKPTLTHFELLTLLGPRVKALRILIPRRLVINTLIEFDILNFALAQNQLPLSRFKFLPAIGTWAVEVGNHPPITWLCKLNQKQKDEGEKVLKSKHLILF